MDKRKVNEFGIPLFSDCDYPFYDCEAPILPHNVYYKGMSYQHIYWEYSQNMRSSETLNEALRRYIIYYAEAPMFDVPTEILQHFRMYNSNAAQMILKLMSFYIEPFEL